MQQIGCIDRTEHLHRDRGRGTHIFHRVIAIGFFQPRLRPALDRQCRRFRCIEQRRFEMTREHQPRIEIERMIVFVIVAFEAVLSVHRLLGTDEADIRIAEGDAIVGVPAAQHRARDFARHAADRGAAPDPARRRIAHPRLAIRLVHVFDRDAADPVRQIVILRGRDGGRQVVEAELLQSGKKAFLLLAAKHAKHELGGVGGAAATDDGENEPGEIGVIQIGNAAPRQPSRVLAVELDFDHVSSLLFGPDAPIDRGALAGVRETISRLTHYHATREEQSCP